MGTYVFLSMLRDLLTRINQGNLNGADAIVRLTSCIT